MDEKSLTTTFKTTRDMKHSELKTFKVNLVNIEKFVYNIHKFYLIPNLKIFISPLCNYELM